MSDPNEDRDPWLDEPWTADELAAVTAAETEEGVPWDEWDGSVDAAQRRDSGVDPG